MFKEKIVMNMSFCISIIKWAYMSHAKVVRLLFIFYLEPNLPFFLKMSEHPDRCYQV